MPNLFHTFSGGVYPHHRKSATRKKEIFPLPPPEEVTIPLRAPGCGLCRPLVRPGDLVAEGQLLGEPEGEDGAPVYASIGGRVTGVEERPLVDGACLPAVTIRREEDAPEGEPLRLQWERPAGEMSREELLAAVRRIGAGDGAGRPLHCRLREAMGRVDMLILNGCESEPLLTADHRVMAEWPEAVVRGARYLRRLLGAQRCVIAVESNKSDAISALYDQLPLRGGSVRVQPLRAQYPQGMERPLVYSLTGRELPRDGSPLDARCVVVGVPVALAVCQGLEQGAPFTRRVVTVAGSDVERPQNLWVPLGTPLEELLRAAGGCKAAPRCFVAGGPMTGLAVTDLERPVEGDLPALLAMGPREPALTRAHPRCLRCGRCMEVCPMHLLPLYFHLYRGRPGQLKLYHLDHCMECGACTYVCPGRVPLADRIRQGKALLEEKEGAQ